MSYEADYILWLEREREKLSFKYDTTKAELYALIEENRKLKEKNEQLEVQKIAFKHSYKQAMEEIERLEKYGEYKYFLLKHRIFNLSANSFFNRKYTELIKLIDKLDEEKCLYGYR